MTLPINMDGFISDFNRNSSANGDTSIDTLVQLMNNSNYSGMGDNPFGKKENVLENTILITAYSILVIISFFGNILVCQVVFKNRRMHTVTNYFIVNLAISDLIVTVLNIPFNLVRHVFDDWPFGDVLCHLTSISQMVSVYVSTFTMTCIAIDRHQVLLNPLRPRLTKYFAIVVIVGIWIVAVTFSLPYGIFNNIQEMNFFTETHTRCRQSFPSNEFEQYLTIITLVLQYAIPLTVIAFAYGRIVHKLWMRTHLGAVTENQQLTQTRAKRKSIKMLITVVVVFAVCWMPLNLYHLLTDIHPDVSVFSYNSNVFFVCHWIAVSSTCYNPFVYCWLNDNFRYEAKSIFRCCYRHSQTIHPGIEVEGLIVRADKGLRRLKTIVSGCTRTTVAGSMLRMNSRREESSFMDRSETTHTFLERESTASLFRCEGGNRSLNSVPEESLAVDMETDPFSYTSDVSGDISSR